MTKTKPGRGGYAAAAFFALAAPLANAGGLALAPVQALAGLAAAPWTRPSAALHAGWAVWLVLAFGAWAAASAFWSPVETGQGARLLGGIICGLFFVGAANESAASRRLIRAAALAALVLLAVHAVVEAAFDMPLNRLGQPDAEHGALMRNPGRGAAFLVMLFAAGFGGWISGSWPIRVIALACAPVVAWTSLQFDMDANALALALAAAAFAFGYLAPRIGILAITSGLAAWLLAAPWLMPLLIAHLQPRLGDLPASWAIRVEVWRFACARIAEQPLIGRGLDSSRSFTGQRAVTHGVEHEIIPLHPHSAPLQIWLETGAIGAALAALTLLVGGWMAARALQGQRAAAASACAALVALGVFWNLSFGAWQEWMVASAFACAALVGASRRQRA